MKVYILFSLILLLISIPAVAQDYPRLEMFGGYSFQRLSLSDSDINETLSELEQLINDLGYTASFTHSKSLKKGFAGSVAVNVNSVLGIVGEVRSHFDTIITGNIPELNISTAIKYRDLSLLAGPRFSLRKHERVTPFAHVLVGLDRWTVSGDASEGGQSIGALASESDTGLGISLGGGMDLSLNDVIAVRLVQADYYLTHHENETLKNLVISSGLVFRIGRDY